MQQFKSDTNVISLAAFRAKRQVEAASSPDTPIIDIHAWYHDTAIAHDKSAESKRP